MYRYGDFENILTTLHGFPTPHRATLRARIKYYRRLKMFGDVQGDRNVIYTFEDLVFWAFMLEVAQFGMDPQRMVQIAWAVWPLVKPSMLHVDSHKGEDLFFAANTRVLSSSVIEQDIGFEHRMSGITSINADERRYTFLRCELVRFLPSRGMIINLSALYRKVEAAVEHFSKGRDDGRSKT